ncbi:DUF6115 domain-containing protein [Domibacillus epiphyticus]|uniref:Swarming motility protein SwrB n=1 Tax=Domibacillus epiphyticus TaxID=1714355 RepID=A0A1V2ACC3_9BACI|nr:hypothetical protein [Domibacillus epiphyticus]OMP68629.1 hypothetical protein BTO28_00840 [Domibacillus epiphyticus]
MTTFLMTISLLLHAVSLLAFILLFQRQNIMKKTEKKMQQMAAETEEMMTAFLMDLKEENEQLITQLSKTQYKRNETMPEPDEEKVNAVQLPPVVPRKTAAKAYAGIKKEPKQPSEQSTIEKMMELKKQGLSDEDIARKLQIGVTEVQLGLKFQRNQ